MKSTMRKTILREIKNSLGRYLAILTIVALGSGFFSGLRIMEPAMRQSGEQYLTEANFYDFRILSTLGFSQEDLEEIKKMEGVSCVEEGISIDFLSLNEEGGERVIRAHSLPQNLNLITLTEGRMPEKTDECVIDSLMVNIEIGDTITLSEGNSEDTKESFKQSTYTVVGKAHSPLYLNMERGSTSLGNGKINGFAYFLKDAFSLDYITEIYLAFDQQYSIYSNEYEKFIQEMETQVQAICDARGPKRLEEIKAEAEVEIADAEQEIADGERKLADAQKELEDARTTLEDGKKELAEKELELLEGKQEIQKGEKEVADALLEIAEGEKELADAKLEIDNGQASLEGAKTELSKGAIQYQNGLTTYEENYVKWENGAAQITTARATLETNRLSLQEGWAKYQQGMDSLTAIKDMQLDTLAGYDSAKADENTLKGKPDLTQEEQMRLALYAQLLPAIDQQLAALGGPIDAALQAIVPPMVQAEETKLQGAKTTLDASQLEFNAGEAKLKEEEQKLSDAKVQLDAAKGQLEQAQAQLDEGGKQIAEGQTKLNQGKEEWEKGVKELEDGKKKATEAQSKLTTAKADMAEGEQKITEAKEEIAEGEEDLLEGEAEYEEESAKANADIEEGKTKIADARKELSDLKEPEYYLLGRDTNIGYVCFENDSGIVQEISKVFPLFFFLIAALVCMTTMNRMVEEQRTQIGVLKALGYSNLAIMSKYIIYAGSAAFIGCILGFFGGSYIFPTTIWQAYSIMYEFTDRLIFIFDWQLLSVTLMVYLLCSVGAAYLSCRTELKSVAAVLLRPKSPKSGKRVLLERIPFIWNRLKFLYKVSIRNVMRFKKRFFMMVLGISGCTALLVAGFGIKDSIADVVGQQYEEIQQFDLAVYFKEGLTMEEETEFEEKSADYLADYFYVAEESVDVESDGKKESLTLITPRTPEDISNFISIHSKKQETLPFPEVGQVILTEKKAKRLNISVGDTVRIITENQNEIELTVTGIAQNYVSSFAYIHPETYQQLCGKIPEYKGVYVKLQEGREAEEAAGQISDLKQVASVSANEVMRERFDSMMGSLDYIVILVIFCAAALAFVVLYNLTNINITERIREIATIKVLGFYPMETAAYVFRENMVLAGLGAFVGLALGKILHAFIIETIDIEAVSFQVKILGISYGYSFVLTIFFAMFVNFIMFFKLEKINMAESLKSIE